MATFSVVLIALSSLFGCISTQDIMIDDIMIDDIYCENQRNQKVIELKPSKDYKTPKSFKDLGCDLKIMLLKTANVEYPDTMKINLTWVSNIEVTATVLKEEIIDDVVSLDNLEVNLDSLIGPYCGCLIMDVDITAVGLSMEKMKKKLEIICPRDGKITIMKPSDINTKIKAGGKIENLTQIIVLREGSEIWNAIGHQSLALTAGIRCSIGKSDNQWHAMGNYTRLRFGDFPLDKYSRLDSKTVENGINYIGMDEGLFIDNNIKCQAGEYATLMLAVDSTGMINQGQEMEAGWMIGVEIVPGETLEPLEDGRCEMYQAYENDNEAWVVYENKNNMEKSGVTIYKVNEKKVIKRMDETMTVKDAALTMGLAPSPMRKCVNKKSLTSQLKSIFVFLNEEAKKRKLIEPTTYMETFDLIIDIANLFIVNMKNGDQQAIGECLSDAQVHLLKPWLENVMVMIRNMEMVANERFKRSEREIEDPMSFDQIQSWDPSMLEELKSMDPMAKKDLLDMMESIKNFNSSEFSMMEDMFANVDPQMLDAVLNKIEGELFKDRRLTDADFGNMLKKIVRCRKLLVIVRNMIAPGSEVLEALITKLKSGHKFVQNIMKNGTLQLPSKFVEDLKSMFQTMPPIELMYCKKETFSAYLMKISEIIRSSEGTSVEERGTLDVIKWLESVLYGQGTIRNEIIRLLSGACEYILNNDLVQGELCENPEPIDKCILPWKTVDGMIYAGNYSPLIGQTCFHPVMICNCATCKKDETSTPKREELWP